MSQGDLFPPEELLREARQRVEAGRSSKNGIECPCCGQLAKVYRRKFTGAMARALIWLYRQGGAQRFVHVNEVAPRWVLSFGGYFALMRHWGLIEAAPREETDAKRSSGFWRLTALGTEFVLKRRAIPSHCHLYDNVVIGWSEERFDIGAALGGKFDYRELMGEAARGAA